VKNLVITGFMATGKSTVGRAVAKVLGMDFVDMDEVIEAQAGMAISEMFARHGEDTFREAESALARELGAREGVVIATGGGTMMRAENRAALEAKGLITCLTCAPEEVLRRVGRDTTRPMLKAPDRLERIKELLAIRMPVYKTLPVLIDTTGRDIAAVVAAVVKAYQDEGCRDSGST
jgi:shikimate kinase